MTTSAATAKTVSSRNLDLGFPTSTDDKSPGQTARRPKVSNSRLVSLAMRTSVQTKTRHLVGTTEYRATARQVIPLDDPTKFGNNGLEGFDEDYVTRTFKSKAAAVRWLRSQAVELPHVQLGEVVQVEWEADEFDDREYGLVLDAIDVDVRQWDFHLTADGFVQVDDWRPHRA